MLSDRPGLQEENGDQEHEDVAEHRRLPSDTGATAGRALRRSWIPPPPDCTRDRGRDTIASDAFAVKRARQAVLVELRGSRQHVVRDPWIFLAAVLDELLSFHL